MNSDKSSRVKEHFARTARNMILSGGVESLSARKIASKAGYSLGTVYNHFKNLHELLWMTRELFIEEIAASLPGGSSPFNKTQLLNSFLSYADFYIQNRNVFSFLYFHKLDPAYKSSRNITEGEEFFLLHKKRIEELAVSESIIESKAESLFSIMNYSVHGLLTLCFAENDSLEPSGIPEKIEELFQTLFS